MISFANALRIFGALSVLLGSLWGTLAYFNYRDQQNVAARPSSQISESKLDRWHTSSKASSELRDGIVKMHGPGYVYAEVEAECSETSCNAEFIIDIQQADTANMGLRFVDSGKAVISEPIIREISGMKAKTGVAVQAVTPAGTSAVQALVYSPKPTDIVVFNNPVLRIQSKFSMEKYFGPLLSIICILVIGAILVSVYT